MALDDKSVPQTRSFIFWFIRGFGGITVWNKTEVFPILHPDGMKTDDATHPY